MRRGGTTIPSSTFADVAAANVAPVDFRRPSRIGRDAVVALESVHDAFVRRLSNAWSTGSYAAVELEHVATDQLSIDDFVRSLPVPTALASLQVPALEATAFIQVDLPFALLYLERALGGMGDPASASVARRPTDIEASLITHEVFGPALPAIDEALRELGGDRCEIQALETAPQPLQLGSPGELLLLFTYRVEVRGDLPGQGLVTLAYPVAALLAHLDQLIMGSSRQDDAADERAHAAMAVALENTTVALHVRIGESPINAARLATLQVGDVLSLDHPAERPARLICDDRVVGTAHLGRRGRRLAAQIVTPPTEHPS